MCIRMLWHVGGEAQLAGKRRRTIKKLHLKGQATLAGSIGKSPDPAVVPEAAAIEAHHLDVLLLAKLCNFGAHKLGCLLIVTASLSKLLADLWSEGGCRCKSETSLVVDNLCIDMVVRTENC